MCFYDLDAKFIKFEHIPDKYTDFIFINKEIFAASAKLSFNLKNDRIKFYDTNGIVVDSINHYKEFSENNSWGDGLDGIFYRYNDSIYYKEKHNDTIFQISQDLKLIPEYAINAGKYSTNLEEQLSGNKELLIKRKTPVVLFENNRFIISFVRGIGFAYCLIDKKSDIVKIGFFRYNKEMQSRFEDYPEIIDKTLRKKVPPFFRIGGNSSDGKKLLGFEYLKEKQFDNPVVVIVELKEQ